jgi:hypothetical protein
LLDHDQKKTIKKVEMGKISQTEQENLNGELNKFYKAFVGTFKNRFGYVSYKKLQKYLEYI